MVVIYFNNVALQIAAYFTIVILRKAKIVIFKVHPTAIMIVNYNRKMLIVSAIGKRRKNNDVNDENVVSVVIRAWLDVDPCWSRQ
jgi:hypothetical protein